MIFFPFRLNTLVTKIARSTCLKAVGIGYRSAVLIDQHTTFFVTLGLLCLVGEFESFYNNSLSQGFCHPLTVIGCMS